MRPLLLLLLTSFLATAPAPVFADFVPLFDGKTLTGWKQLGGAAKYEVKDGAIVGTSVPNTPNSFLCTEKNYGDFILELEVKVDSRLNSGIQYRSNSLPDYKNGQVHGLQFELDPSDRAWTGGIYEEGRRGWLQNLEANDRARYAFKRDEWNKVRIETKGSRIRTFLNDVLAGSYEDDMTMTGFFALQVHGVGKEETPMSVSWRNIRLFENPPADEYETATEASLPDKVVPDDVKPELIQGGFKFTEGPALAKDGRIFFTDIPNNRIHVYDPANGAVTVHRENSGAANGLKLFPSGGLVACEGGLGQVTLQVAGGEAEPITKEFNGVRYNGPNDLDMDGKGGFYFTDPNYSKDPAPQGKECVYYVASGKVTGKGKVIRVVEDCVKPNGVLLSLDKKTLYVCDNGAGTVRAYDINPKDGTTSNGRVFCTIFEGKASGGDGMTIDESGNLYVAAQKYIRVFDPTGKPITKIAFPEAPANCVFGAQGTSTLYVTARTGFYKVKLNRDGRK